MCGEGGKYVGPYITLVEVPAEKRDFGTARRVRGGMILKLVLNLQDV
jgi:hypothetical protein